MFKNKRDAARGVLEFLSLVLTIVVGVTLLYRLWGPLSAARKPPVATRGQNEPLPDKPIAIGDSPTLGNRDARVSLMVFSDFQCPYCAQFASLVWPSIEQNYVRAGSMSVTFRHLPLSIHQRAMPAAIAAECAHDQNRFWEMHDLLFADPKHLEESDLKDRAAKLKLDGTNFGRCMSSPEMAARIKTDTELASKLQVRGTPTFLLGRNDGNGMITVVKRWSGAGSVQLFRDNIEELSHIPVR